MADIFISYSRANKEFVANLRKGLKIHRPSDNQELDVWLDLEDIEFSADWWTRICKGITESNNFVIVLSADYLASEICIRELEHAAQYQKRIIPLALESYNDIVAQRELKLTERPWETLDKGLSLQWWNEIRKLNFIDFTTSEKFDTNISALVENLFLDIAYVDNHTRLLNRALQWDANNRDASYLLTGEEITLAEQWQVSAATKKPDMTELHAEYIRASREAERIRQRNIRRGISVALVVALSLTILSLFLYQNANVQRNRADNNAATSESSASTATVAQGQALDETQNRATQQAIAERNADVSQSLALSASSREALANNDQDLALALALEAIQISDPPIQSQRTLQQLAYLPGTRKILDTGAYSRVAISPNGKLLLAGTIDAKVKLWSLVDGILIRDFERSPYNYGVVTALQFSADGQTAYVLFENSNHIVLFAVETGNFLSNIPIPDADLKLAPNFNQDGSLLAVRGNTPGQYGILVYDTYSGELLLHLERGVDEAIGFISQMEFIDNNFLLVTTEQLGNAAYKDIIIWDLKTGQEITALELQAPTTIAASKDGHTVLAANNDTIFVFDIENPSAVNRFNNSVIEAAFLPDNERVLLTTLDGGVIIWDSDTGQTLYRMKGIGIPTDIVISPDGNYAIVSSFQELRWWDLTTGLQLRQFDTNESGIQDIAYSGSGEKVLASSHDGLLWLFDNFSGQLLGQYKYIPRYPGVYSVSVNEVAISPDEQSAVTAGEYIIWFDLASGEELMRYVIPFDQRQFSNVHDLKFTYDGKSIVYFIGENAGTGEIILYNLESGKEELQFVYPPNFGADRDVRSLIFDSTGKYLLTAELLGLRDGSTKFGAYLYDVSDGSISHSYPHESYLTSAIFSPDETTILASDSNGIITQWHLESEEEVRRFTGHTSSIITLAAQGNLLVSADLDGLIVVWNLLTGEEIFRYRGSFEAIRRVAFSANGNSIIAASQDGTIKTWQINADTLQIAAWLANNRYVYSFSCGERFLYNIQPLCDEGVMLAEASTPYPTFVPTLVPENSTIAMTPTSDLTNLYQSSTLVESETGERGELWILTANAGDWLEVNIKSETCDTILIFKSPQNIVLHYIDDNPTNTNSTLSAYRLPETGQYLLFVRDHWGFECPYQLEAKLYTRFPTDIQLDRTERGLLGIASRRVGETIQVTSVGENSAAEKAGIQVGDIILAVNRQNLPSEYFISLNDFIVSPPGFPMTLELKRGNEIIDLSLQMGLLIQTPEPTPVHETAISDAEQLTLDLQAYPYLLYEANLFPDTWNDFFQDEEEPNYNISWEDSALKISGTAESDVEIGLWSNFTPAFKDGVIQLQFSVRESDHAGIGLIIRNTDAQHYYSIIVVQNKVGALLNGATPRSLEDYVLNDEVNLLTLFARDSTIRAYMNGTLVLSDNINLTDSGHVSISGFFLNTPSEPTEAIFHSLKIYTDSPTLIPTPTATPQALNQEAKIGTQSGSIHVGSGDLWQYIGTANDNITIQIVADQPLRNADGVVRDDSSAGLDTAVFLYAPDGQLIAFNDDSVLDQSTNSSIENVVLPTTGIYQIEVRSLTNQEQGTYTLIIE